MKRKDDGAFVQDVPLSTWQFNVSNGQKAIHIIGAYSADLMTKYDIDESQVEDGVVTVSFGLDSHSGVLKYSYETEINGDEATVISGNGGTITVNQYNNGVPNSQL